MQLQRKNTDETPPPRLLLIPLLLLHYPWSRQSLCLELTHTLPVWVRTTMAGSLRSPTPPRPRPSRETGNAAEQLIFEQRLCEDGLGIAIRKINQNGKANLRYIRCVGGNDLDSVVSNSNRSIGSQNKVDRSKKYLVWGKKNQISIDKFTVVRKGKTTDKTRRNGCPSYRLLSIFTSIPNVTLDIEAPTKVDRDKFARAFSRFLKIPLEEADSRSATASSSNSENLNINNSSNHSSRPPKPRLNRVDSGNSRLVTGSQTSALSSSHNHSSSAFENEGQQLNHQEQQVILSQVDDPKEDDASAVSSLTGHGFDHDLVEELQTAITELRMELEDSRAEAARAVKVAEQAIQSAEKNRSVEWQNTVTHKAAEAAAIAQKRSAEAMAKQRRAEEKLEEEKEEARYWRKQAEASLEQAGILQTKAAAASLQRATLEEKLESERTLLETKLELLHKRFEALENIESIELTEVAERNLKLENEIMELRQELNSRPRYDENNENVEHASRRKLLGFGRKKQRNGGSIETKSLLSGHNASDTDMGTSMSISEPISSEMIRKLQNDSSEVRQQFEMLRQEASVELRSLPKIAAIWGTELSAGLAASTNEIERLRLKLAAESAVRRKLLNEVQDLRGNVRVYCRPKPYSGKDTPLEFTSRDTLMLHRPKNDSIPVGPLAFEFDGVFEPNTSQGDLYAEMEDVLLGVLDGYRVCFMSYGQSHSGKTFSMLGEISADEQGVITVRNEGIQFRILKQMFSIANQRKSRIVDSFKLTIVEVCDDRLTDVLVDTTLGVSRGNIMNASTNKRRSKPEEDSGRGNRLEIKTDIHGDTVVQGALSLEIRSYEDFLSVHQDCLKRKKSNESSCHVITTLSVTSADKASRAGSFGKLQFVDFASADLAPSSGADSKPPSPVREGNILKSISSDEELRFTDRSLEKLSEVVSARAEYSHSVPYRNSTLTHLIRDCLEADTKVILLACLSMDPRDIEETASTLRFASKMRKVIIGKATQHTLSPP